MTLRTPFRRKASNPEGRMALLDHFKELRNRLLLAAAAVFVGLCVGWYYYEEIADFLMQPVVDVAEERGTELSINFGAGGVTQPFTIKAKIAAVVGVILASPIWLWQFWAFILPGLYRREKLIAFGYFLVAVPMFLAGCLLAIWALPTAVKTLLANFIPQGGGNFTAAEPYFAFVGNFILWFGVAFLLPVVMVAINHAGLLSGRVMLKGWRWATVGVLVFAAMAAPDPMSMVTLTIPMMLMYFVACGIAMVRDKARRRKRPEWMDADADTASAL